MWKVVLLLLAVFVIGHFAVRYLRKNPLDPVIEGGQVVVESQDDSVRFTRNGAVSGTYFVVGAKSEDWTNVPVNLRLEVLEPQAARDYLAAYPDFHLYRSESGSRLAQVAARIALIAGNRETYGTLRGLLDEHESRARNGGERLCVRLSGEALSLASAESLEDGTDRTSSLERMAADSPVVYVDDADVGDCSELLAARKR